MCIGVPTGIWNDDTIAANTGFPPHPHANMEIITYVQGAITHQDSIGSLGRTGAGDVQVMSAGIGIRHSEYNREVKIAKFSKFGLFQMNKAVSYAGEPTFSALKPMGNGAL